MPTRRYPTTRWTSTHKVRRARQRWRSTRLPGWSGPENWARALEIAGEVLAGPAGTPTPPHRTPGCREGRSNEATPAFVELFPALPIGGTTPWTIELSDPCGRKLTVSLRGAPGPELVALTRALWSGRR